jgi:PAS domain-containing protein
MELNDVGTLLAGLAAFSASVLGVIALFKGAIIPFCRWCRKVKTAVDLHTTILPARIDRIYQEVTPNGGSSLKDSVNRIETRQLIQEQRQHAYASQLTTPIFETDATGACTWVNKAYLDFVDANPEDVLGHGWINFIAYEDQHRVADSWASAIRDERAFRLEYMMVPPEGPTRVLGETTVIRDNNGAVLGYIGSFTAVRD